MGSFGNRFKELEFSKLVKASWNYKEEEPRLQSKLLENIKRNGQLETIIVESLRLVSMKLLMVITDMMHLKSLILKK